MSLAGPFVRRPVASSMVAVAFVLMGGLAYRLLPVAPMPEVDFPLINVHASLPGASPETLASSVTTPLERALGSIAGVASISSYCKPGATDIRLEFDLGKDINDAAREVQAALREARSQLPAGMPQNPSYNKINPSAAPIMALALSSANLAPGTLYDFASSVLAQKISQVPGVGSVSVAGSSLPAVRVQLNPSALAHRGIALDEVRRAIGDANSVRPRGAVEADGRQWQVQLGGQLRRAEEYRPLVIRYGGGGPVRLEDVAMVSDSVEDRNFVGFHNARRAVLLMISRQPDANIIATIDAINRQMPEFRALLPADADLAVVLDRSPAIRATLHESQQALLLAVGLVMLVVFLFLANVRGALITSVAIPVSLIGAFALMYLQGFSLNNLSLMALIVAAGLVVDDAIVVLENIMRHMEAGLPPVEAAIRGAGEVGFTLLAMTLSLITVFVSILFMGGIVERLFREFSLTLASAMLASLVVSLTLVPGLCARYLGPESERPPGRFQQASRRAHEAVRARYALTLGWILQHPRLVLVALAGIIALNWSLYYSIPKGFLPEQDTGQLQVFIHGDNGLSAQVMRPKVEAYRKLLRDDPAVQDVIGTAGGGTGTSNAWILVRLKPLQERGLSAREVINRLRGQAPLIPGSTMRLMVAQDISPPRSSSGGSYDVTLMAGEVGLVREWAPKVSRALMALPELIDVDPPVDGGFKQVMLHIDREAAHRLGVDMRMVTSVLNNSFSQRPVSTLYDNLNQYRVIMELEPQYTADPAVLEQLQVITADGSRVPLSAFTRYEYALIDERVNHREQFAAANIAFDLAPGVSLQEGLAAIDRAMAGIMLPPGVQVRQVGSTQNFQNAFANQHWLILGVLVAVYLVLGILYESLIHPLTILSTLPSAGLGALLALRLTGTEFSLVALLGLFLLIGIVMKNAILMIDFALARERRDGLTPFAAIHEAAQMRLRPILMTNLATLLGALPLVISFGQGAEMRRPLGLAIVGGLMVSQLLTLYTVPVVYLWLDRVRFRLHAYMGSRKSVPGEPGTAVKDTGY
jgi:multidrug efflux pump